MSIIYIYVWVWELEGFQLLGFLIYLVYLNTGIYSVKIDINLSKIVKAMAHVNVNEIISKNNYWFEKFMNILILEVVLSNTFLEIIKIILYMQYAQVRLLNYIWITFEASSNYRDGNY